LQQNFPKENTVNFNTEQFATANQANLNAAAGLSQSVFAGFERLVELNMAAGKAAMSESFANMQALMAANSPQDLIAVQAALVQPAIEKSVSYVTCLTSPTALVPSSPRPSKAKWPSPSKL
jgi:phasin family protein